MLAIFYVVLVAMHVVHNVACQEFHQRIVGRSLQEPSSLCRGRAGIPDHVGLFLVLCVHIISIFGEGMCDSLLIIAFQWFMLEMKVILQLDLQDMDSQSPQLP